MGAAQTNIEFLDRSSFSEAETRFMRRALELAARGEGRTSPNPLVGALVVRDGAVIGEGWHKRAGGPHAEVMALAQAGENAKGATIFITLEPCNHHGRTPPCVNAIIDAGVAQVIYALDDPNPQASGGADALRAAGLEVRGGLLTPEAQEKNRFWLHTLESDRPYVIAKFAMSLDGKIATRRGDSQWITGAQARARGHDLRHMVDAILVGAQTVLADDPALTARPDGRDGANPLRVVLDSTARTSPGALVYDDVAPGAVLATTTRANQDALERFEEHGVPVLTTDRDTQGRVDAHAVLRALKARGANAVMIEGGGEILGACFDAGLVDEVWAFTAPIIIGGNGKAPVAGLGAAALTDAARLCDVTIEPLGGDFLMRGRIRSEEG